MELDPVKTIWTKSRVRKALMKALSIEEEEEERQPKRSID